MKRQELETEEKYEIVIRRFGGEELIETDIMGDRETQEILGLIGRLNLRSAIAG